MVVISTCAGTCAPAAERAHSQHPFSKTSLLNLLLSCRYVPPYVFSKANRSWVQLAHADRKLFAVPCVTSPPPHFHLMSFCLARWRDVSRTPVMYDTSLLSSPDRPPCSPGLVRQGIVGKSCAPACIFVCNVITMVTHLCGNDVWSRTERDLWVSASTVGRGHRGGLIQTSQWALD